MKAKLKALAGDTVVYGVFQILGRFLTFLLTPIYTNFLSYEEVGEIGFIYSIIAFINIIYSFGIESAFFRFFDKDNDDNLKKVFSHAYFIIAAISGFFSITFLLLAKPIGESLTTLPDATNLIRAAALIPFLDALILIPYGLLRMKRRARKFALTRFALIILAVLNNFIFVVWLRQGAMGVLIAQLIASAVGFIVFIPELVKYIKLKIDFKLLFDMIKFGLPTLPSNLSSMILLVADRPLLKALATQYDVAMYTVNNRLGIPMLVMVTVFDYAWKPFYLSHHEDEEAKSLFARVLTYFTLVCAFVFLLASLNIDFIVRMPFVGGKFINPHYWTGLGIMPIVLLGLFFSGVNTNFAAGFLITKNTKYIPMAVGFAALVSLSSNLILIPKIGYWGSAWSLLIGYFSGSALMWKLQQKVYPTPYEWARLAKIFVSAAIVYFAADLLTLNLTLWLAFLIKNLFIVAFLIVLKLMGFFTSNEIDSIRQLIKSRKK